MLGGSFSVLMCRIAGMESKDSERRDYLGQWKSFDIKGNNKIMRVFNIHRIINLPSLGI